MISKAILRYITKFFVILLPSCVVSLVFLTAIHVQAYSKHALLSQNPYPNPLLPKSYSQPQSISLAQSNAKAYLPLVLKPWEYLPITPPTPSSSIYIRSVDNYALYQAGCEQGSRDQSLPGTQDSIIFIHFGQPWKIGNEYGVRLNETYTIITTTRVANAVMDYARGYWACTGSDHLSHVTIAAGTSNDSDNYTTYQHGVAWAQMIIQANDLLQASYYKTQVSLAGASNMELGFNGPGPTRNWVDGFNDAVYDSYQGEVLFRLYDVGDAAGCAPYYGDCGTPDYPDWDQEDVWYIAYGCESCYPLPMIYSNDWVQAEQWQNLSKYSHLTYGYKIVFPGTITQYGACATRTCEPQLDNTAEDGFKQLYTVLNSDVDTAQDLSTLKWSTDIKWWGE